MTTEETKLLSTLNERTANILHLVEKQEAHLRELNGSVREHAVEISRIKVFVEGENGLINRVSDLECKHSKLKQTVWIAVGLLVGSGVIGTGLYGLLS